MKVGLKFEGGKELQEALDRLSTRVQRNITADALTAAAAPIKSIAESIAPRGEGGDPHLADNISIMALSKRDEERDGVTVAIGPERRPDFVFWGLFQEMGTAFHAAQPFMRPAFDQGHERALDVFKTWLWHSVKQRLPKLKKG